MEILEAYSNAYVEILEIIRCMGKKYEEKIPMELLDLFEEKKNKNYKYHINNIKDFKEKKLLNETLGILSIIELKYWLNFQEKEKLEKALRRNEEKYYEKLKLKYSNDNLFKDRNVAESKKTKDNLLLIEQEKTESYFTIILSKIKIFLRKLYKK